MSITLSDAELITAQDAQSRHPVVEIVSSQNTADIPFDGQFLTEEATNETKPNVITHSTGRLCQVYTFGAYFKYVYTDVNRQEFNFVIITLPTSHVPIEATLCELANGNIGIVYISTFGTTRHLRYMVLSPTGVVVTTDTMIEAYTTATTVIDMPFVMRLANGTFLLVYHHLTVSGAVYRIEKRTCPSDFITWSAESECSVGGLTSTYPKYNPSLMQLSVGDTTGNIFLWFDYRTALTGGVEITNIYYSISTDNGATWTTGVALTSYATTAAVGKHPVSVQKVANEMMLSFHEVRNALYKVSHVASQISNNVTFDPVGRKLYCTQTSQSGTNFSGITEIDVDSWVETNWWDCSTTDPMFSSVMAYGLTKGTNTRWRGEYPLILIGQLDTNTLAVLNVASNSIIEYYFKTQSIYAPEANTVQNVTGITLASNEYLSLAWADAPSNRVYCLLNIASVGGMASGALIRVGYIEFGSYEWHEVVPSSNMPYFAYNNDTTSWLVDVANDRIIISECFGTGLGGIKIYSLSTGAQVKSYYTTSHADFPDKGLSFIARIGERIFGTGPDPQNGANHYGLTEIDLTTDLMYNWVPSWTPIVANNYQLKALIPISSTELAIVTQANGLTIFDINEHTWETITNDNTPGLTPSGEDSFYGGIAYDSTQQIIFSGVYVYEFGVVAVSRYGAFKSAYYKLGTYSAGWTFGAALQLTVDWTDYDLAMAINPGVDDLSIYAFWVKMVSGELSIKWDLDGSSLEISDYIVNGSEVNLHRSIDSSPASLTFTCSHGHLFDPQNILSLYSIYLKKGRKVNLRFGDKVGTEEFWQQQGVFFVVSTKLTYERPNYPTISIEAKDERVFWEQGKILVTDAYETDPNTILTDLMTEFGEFAGANIHFPTLDNSCILWFQWLDVTLQDIVMQICERFGYFHRLDIDGHPTARKISGDNAVDHVYSDVTKLINFTPDDDYSNFINQVIVKGQSHTFIEVLFAEERIETINGSFGWWGGEEKFIIHYSKDKSRRCRNPQLITLRSTSSFVYEVLNYIGIDADIQIELSDEDPDDLWCEVTISITNALTGMLIAAIVLYIATFFLPAIQCVPILGGPCIDYNFPKFFAMLTIMCILSAAASYQLEIRAQPVGKVRQSFQATANDEEFQNLIGKVISETMDDPLCFSQEQCQVVANFNRDVLKYQRNRIKFTKIADLRDEEGDMLQVPHPYTSQVMNIFVTDITRRYQKPSTSGSDDGYFLDDIEGWRIL